MARHFPWIAPRASSPVLVAHVASAEDLGRALNDGWYRLRPCKAVDELGDLRRYRYLALYESGRNAQPPYRIRHYAKIRLQERRLRRDLIPDEPFHERADLPYKVLRIERPRELRHPLYSRWSRTDQFMRTDWNHFIMPRSGTTCTLGHL